MHLSAPFQILSIFVQLENHMKKFLFLALMLAMLVTAALAEPQLSGVFADDVTLTSGEDGWFVEFEASENGTVAMELLSGETGEKVADLGAVAVEAGSGRVDWNGLLPDGSAVPAEGAAAPVVPELPDVEEDNTGNAPEAVVPGDG